MWLIIEEYEYNEAEATTMSKEEEDDEGGWVQRERRQRRDEKKEVFGEEKWRECRICCYEHMIALIYMIGDVNQVNSGIFHLCSPFDKDQ